MIKENRKYEYKVYDRRYFTADEVDELTEGWQYVGNKGSKEIYRRLKLEK